MQWELKGNALDTRTAFIDYILIIVAEYVKTRDDLEKTIISLPKEVTKAERYRIHTFTGLGLLPESYNDAYDNRIMQITITRNYIEKIFENYEFDKVEEVHIVPPIDEPVSKTLFNKLIEFIKTNFSDYFEEYLRTI